MRLDDVEGNPLDTLRRSDRESKSFDLPVTCRKPLPVCSGILAMT